jgi:hypothetical protein
MLAASLELPSELVMMIEPTDETGDHFDLEDVRNLVPHF